VPIKPLQEHQVKELRLHGINTPEEAHAFLDEYRASHNQRFAVTPRNTEEAHRQLLHNDRELTLILSHQSPRTLSKT